MIALAEKTILNIRPLALNEIHICGELSLRMIVEIMNMQDAMEKTTINYFFQPF